MRRRVENKGMDQDPGQKGNEDSRRSDKKPGNPPGSVCESNQIIAWGGEKSMELETIFKFRDRPERFGISAAVWYT